MASPIPLPEWQMPCGLSSSTNGFAASHQLSLSSPIDFVDRTDRIDLLYRHFSPL
ncbi:hypothetical protein IN997_20145 [Pectobacterium punjabense]|nr:hypothetical protein [Pectobacterium punjabense]